MLFVFKEKSVSSLAGRLFEAEGAGGVGGPVLCRPCCTGWLLGDWELASVVPNHHRLDFHLVEGLAVVDAHHAARHVGLDDNVAQVRWPPRASPRASPWAVPHTWPCAGASAASAVSSAGGSAAAATASRAEKLPWLLLGYVQRWVEVQATVGELVEGLLLSTSAVLSVLQKG